MDDETVELTAEEGKSLHDYLFSTEIWESMNSSARICSQSVLRSCLFLFLLDMYENGPQIRFSNGNVPSNRNLFTPCY